MSSPTGTLFVISAPSGAGKTSLVAALCEAMPDLVVSVSYTTRPQRPQEENGVHYHFIDKATFERMLSQEAFLEHANVFGNYYGTARATLETQLSGGIDVILEIDWQGAEQVRSTFPNTSIFILPPSIETLAGRLRARGQDDEAVIGDRMAAAVAEISHYAEFDYLIVNDEFDRALSSLRSIVGASRLRRSRQEIHLKDTLRALTTPNSHE